MIVFPNAKINLGLNVTEKRPDGYHNIESIFYPVAWCDVLEIIPSHSDTVFSSTGIPIPGDPDKNLCLKAYELLSKEQELPPVNIHLHKIIPIGAGLGGGSADGAFALKLLRDMYAPQVLDEKLKALALELGSDCPFFIENKPAYVTGTGDMLETLDLEVSLGTIVLANPGIHIGTKEAYSGITPLPSQQFLPDLLQKKKDWKTELKNDFEKSVFPLHSAVKALKEAMYSMGAYYSAMTGSGSTVYGLFNDLTNFREETLNNSYVRVVR